MKYFPYIFAPHPITVVRNPQPSTLPKKAVDVAYIQDKTNFMKTYITSHCVFGSVAIITILKQNVNCLTIKDLSDIDIVLK
jgi:hypothetical protein